MSGHDSSSLERLLRDAWMFQMSGTGGTDDADEADAVGELIGVDEHCEGGVLGACCGRVLSNDCRGGRRNAL